MSRRSAQRCAAHAIRLGVVVASAAFATSMVGGAAPASGTTSMSVKVTPDHGLVNGQRVTVSGHGVARTDGGSSLTWFVTECTASVRGRMNPSTDTPHCDVTDAQAIRVSRNGTFSTKFHVRAGIVGDGYCGTAVHASCVIGVGNAKGQGTVVRITFAAATTASSTTAP
jgi:hypothetical protein